MMTYLIGIPLAILLLAIFVGLIICCTVSPNSYRAPTPCPRLGEPFPNGMAVYYTCCGFTEQPGRLLLYCPHCGAFQEGVRNAIARGHL